MPIITELRGRYYNGRLILEITGQRYYRGAYAHAKGESTTEVVPTGPWAPQAPYLQQLFQRAAGLVNQPPPQYPSGPTVATSPTLAQNQNDIMSFIAGAQPTINAATNTAMSAATTANPVSSAAAPLTSPLQQGILSLISGGNPALNTATSLAPTAVNNLTSTINAAPVNAAGPLGGQNLAPQYGSAIGQLLTGNDPASSFAGAVAQPAAGAVNRAVSGPTAAFNAQGAPINAIGGLDMAGEVSKSLQGGALNPMLDQIIQSSMRSLNRQFTDETVPGIRDAAMAAGQRGGSSEGVARGIAASRLNETAGDVITQIMSNAFNQSAAERGQALNIGAQAAGQNPAMALETARINEMIRAGQMGEGLSGAQLALQSILGGTQNQLGAANTAASTMLDSARLNETARQSQVGASLGASGSVLDLLMGGTNAGLNATQVGTGQAADLLSTGSAQGMTQLFQALGMVPALSNTGLNQLSVGNQVGLQQLGQNQAQIDSDIARFFFEQFAPYAQLAQFQNFITGGYGSSVNR